MARSIVPSGAPAPDHAVSGRFDLLARRVLFSLLRRLRRGELTIVDGDDRQVFGVCSDRFPLRATITVHHPRCYSAVVLGGSSGTGEAYMAGYWSADHLTNAIRIIVLNQDLFEGVRTRRARLALPLYLFIRLLHRNTRRGSRDNIVAHYDLGNDFYALFLDETMTYSCGIFERPDSTLAEASLAKYERVCRKLRLAPSDHVLEIGTGWGGFALYAARHFGCRVTTTTISPAQHGLARERIREAGLESRVTLLQEDYRDLKGCYDKLVSIEMIEAVGHQHLDTFFERCGSLLEPDGMMLLQAITIADWAFERHKHSVDFIKRHIFPGSCIPSVTAMCDAAAGGTDLRLVHLEEITPHYARTLRAWRERFFNHLDRVRAMGLTDRFIRMWEFYLCYCEAGFEERYLGDVQMVLAKPLSRHDPILPALPGT